jgi:hypothetical protein
MTQRPAPSDEDLDRLLASQLKRTSPKFELRWRQLRAGFGIPAPRRGLSWWLFWPGIATAGLAAFALVTVLRHSSNPAPVPDATAWADVFRLEAALAPAAPLLDRDTRDAVIHLPTPAEL